MNERAITEPRLGRKAAGRVVRKLCELGATTKDLAEVFAVSEEEMERWLRGYNDVSLAAANGRVAAINNISNLLLRRANGMNVTQRRIVSVDGVAAQVTFEETKAPDLEAANALLDEFRRRPELEPHSKALQKKKEEEMWALVRSIPGRRG